MVSKDLEANLASKEEREEQRNSTALSVSMASQRCVQGIDFIWSRCSEVGGRRRSRE